MGTMCKLVFFGNKFICTSLIYNMLRPKLQIMGGAVAVKKSLVAVSGRLLVKHQNGGAPMAISSREVFPKYIDHPPVARPPSPGKQRFSYSQDDRLGSSQRMVVFRFLCSNDTAGGVIGTGGKSVKALENETAASIKFADYLGGSNERIVIISALEVYGFSI